MIDTLLILGLIHQNLDKVTKTVTKTITHNPTGLSTGVVALYASIIGASAVIASQVVIFLLNTNKEKRNKKKELVSEERRLAFMLTELYKELVMHKVHKKYWLRTSEILNPNTDDSKDSHERHFLSNQRSFDALARIRTTTSEYIKVVNYFLTIANKNDVIDEKLKKIKEFVPRKASDFNEVTTYDELLKAQSVEEGLLNIEYLFYSTSYDSIYTQMKTKIK